MYNLQLLDGTIITNLQKVNSSTFELDSNDSSIYHKLNDYNLTLALLLEGELLDDVFIDYKRTNFNCAGGKVRFRIDRVKGGVWDEFKSLATT